MGGIALPAGFHGLSFLPARRAKDGSQRESLNLQPKNERTRSRVFPTTLLQSSSLRCRMRNILCPIATRAAIFFFGENKKDCRQGRLLPSTSPAASHVYLVKLSGNGYVIAAWI